MPPGQRLPAPGVNPPVGLDLLREAELSVRARILPASNHTFLCDLGSSGERAVYKPTLGERPLWDFPDGSLADREYAAWLVSESLGWGIVPPTVLREGPHGWGMAQLWCEPAPDQRPVDVIPSGPVPAGLLRVLTAEDETGNDVELVHEDSTPLLVMAVFDVLTNNTDRKGGHILAMDDGRRLGVDHGICFHTDDKLRTVLWGFAGRRLPDEVAADVTRCLDDAALLDQLEEHLAVEEVAEFVRRGRRLLEAGVMPQMGPGWPAIPWPPF